CSLLLSLHDALPTFMGATPRLEFLGAHPTSHALSATCSRRSVKFFSASARRVGTCSLGTSRGSYSRISNRATVTLCTSSGPSYRDRKSTRLNSSHVK